MFLSLAYLIALCLEHIETRRIHDWNTAVYQVRIYFKDVQNHIASVTFSIK